MSRSIYINLPVKDVAAAREFYTRMGFKLNQAFSNDQNAVIIVDEHILLMLVAEGFFKQNVGRDVADTAKVSEVGLAIQVASRAEVDTLFDAAIAAGGKAAGETVEEAEIGMYSRGLTDLDGHRLDILYMTA
jgi:uncharacterized protein